MRKTLSVIAIVLLAFPAIGQDDFGGGGFGGGFEGVLTGGDIDALLGGGNRGNRGNNNNNNVLNNPEGLFLQLRDLLKAQKAPLSKDQEKTLRTFIETETTAIRTDIETQMANRGGNRGNNVNTMTLLQDIFTIVGKNNTELLTTMKADLTSDQVSLITKAEKDKKVCSVMMDMFNPAALQNRNNNNNRGNNNNNQNLNNLPFGIEGFDLGGGGNQGNRGNNNQNWQQQFPDRTFCTTAASTPAERLAPISQILTKGKKPLTAEQEKKFVGLIEAKVPVMQQEIRDKEPRMLSLINDINNQGNNQNRGNNNQNNNNNNPPAVNPQTLRNNIVNTVLTQLGVQNNNNNNNNNNNRGGRGNFNQNNPNQNNQNQNNNPANAANAAAANNDATANNAAAANNQNNQNRGGNRGNNNNNNFNNFNPQAEIQKKTEELYDKVAASLNPDQGKIVKKLKYDQIKARGGVERYRGIMEQEGTPLTPEQMTQIQNLMNTQYTALRQFAETTVQAEMDKQPTLEPPAPAPTQNNNNQNQNQNRPNPNNVAQNPIAQQIIAKVMPLVSQRRAILEKSVTDTIMKVLTPSQVASYKLSSM